ncbi:MAG: transcriptional regulator FtsR [Actinomycetota bacterium]
MNEAFSHQDSNMSIGEVIAMLSPDFPDVSVSKLRLWESEGLVEPARTPAGYRKYTYPDVERLRYALTLQRDQYWPLRRIRAHLAAVIDGTEEPLTSARMSPPNGYLEDKTKPPAVAPTRIGHVHRRTPTRLSAAELCARAGLSADQLDELVSYGLLAPGGAGWYDSTAVDIAVAAGELSRFGIEPRHLRSFRAAADREVGLVEQIVNPLRASRGETSRARAHEIAREVAAAALKLHESLVSGALIRAGLDDLH